MMKFDIISIFPDAFNSYLESSLIEKAGKKKLLKVRVINPRDFTFDKHNTVDSPPYGGGPGMVLKAEPIWKAVSYAKKGSKGKKKIILFSLRGGKFTDKKAKELSKYKHLILICGRYEGVDERVAKYLADEEVSIGDFVLSGGELPALLLIESVSRYIKGFLGKEESLESIKGSYPTYTRPRELNIKVGGKSKNLKVPDVLLGGNHAEIIKWRKK